MDPRLAQIRAFNRTVTRRIGVLNERYLGRNRPLAESRLLYEIGADGAAVRALRARLGLDSGFVSRLLRALERKGLATTSRRSGDDRRSRFARLTRSGLVELKRVNTLSDALAGSMLEPLTAEQGRRLLAAMDDVDRLLRTSAAEIAADDPSSTDAQFCLDRYFSELETRFRDGFDRRGAFASAAADYSTRAACLLIVRLFGESIGCGTLRAFEPRVGEIKRMWVAPSARGLGVGRRLLGALEREARRRKMRAIRLDTNEALTEALGLYQTAGYREIDRYNDNPYAHHWFEKALG